MKHFIILSVFALFNALGLFAQRDLLVFSDDGMKFKLEVNGVIQNNEPTTNVKVADISQEFVTVRVIFADENFPPLKKSFTLVQNMETSAKLTLKKGQYKLRYNGQTPISRAVTPNQTVINYGEEPVAVSQPVAEPTPAPAASTTTTTTTIKTTEAPANGENVSMNVNIGGQNIGISTSMTGMETTASSTVTSSTTTTTTTQTNQPVNTPAPAQPAETVSSGGCDSPMPTGDFSSALSSMDSKSFEDSKMTLAKQFTKANCLSANQIKLVMQKFTYEESKLEYAKFAYPYCMDQPSYYKVNDAFKFELTIDDLNEFLETQ